MVRLTNRGKFFLLTVLLIPVGLGLSNAIAEPPSQSAEIELKEPFDSLKFANLLEPRDYAQAKMKVDYGWSNEERKCLGILWGKESAWNYKAASPTDDYGIPQRHMRNDSKEEIKDFLNNPYVQIDWGLNYIKTRYGSPCQAWKFWSVNRWY